MNLMYYEDLYYVMQYTPVFILFFSTISSCFNSLTAVTMQDIIRPHFRMYET